MMDEMTPPGWPQTRGNDMALRSVWTDSWTSTTQVICPDLLAAEKLGEADRWRGRLIRGFIRLLDWLGI